LITVSLHSSWFVQLQRNQKSWLQTFGVLFITKSFMVGVFMASKLPTHKQG
jgi:hypothetical protein